MKVSTISIYVYALGDICRNHPNKNGMMTSTNVFLQRAAWKQQEGFVKRWILNTSHWVPQTKYRHFPGNRNKKRHETGGFKKKSVKNLIPEMIWESFQTNREEIILGVFTKKNHPGKSSWKFLVSSKSRFNDQKIRMGSEVGCWHNHGSLHECAECIFYDGHPTEKKNQHKMPNRKWKCMYFAIWLSDFDHES